MTDCRLVQAGPDDTLHTHDSLPASQSSPRLEPPRHPRPQSRGAEVLPPPIISPQQETKQLRTSAALNAPRQNPALAHPVPAVTVSQEQHSAASASTPPSASTNPDTTSKWQQPRQELDGNNTASHTVKNESLQVTPISAIMSGRASERFQQQFPARPPMNSQNSHSVPSTPHQHPRDLGFRSRTPSPNGGLGSHSPRSVSSEANGALPSLRPYRCKYETAQAFGRRRIPYESADALEPAPQTPKASLDPHEDEKLSGDMRELYDRILPSQESEERRGKLVEKLLRLLRDQWPGNDFKVHVFGSSGNLLCTTESDVDICIQTPMRQLESVHMLADLLAKRGMSKVVCVATAKVPIVKFWDPELMLACDINVNNTLALDNTRMIKTYVQIDERVRPLTMIVKHWTKQRILNDAALGGTLSSYTWICMVLNFLQTRDPPILPSLHKMSPRKDSNEANAAYDFYDDLGQLRDFGKANTESIGQLLFHFFRRYGHELDYQASVVSVRQGKLLTRQEKGWEFTGGSKEGRWRLCVEEPFNTSRNLGNSADDYAFRGIHLEIRQAFGYLADGGQLDKACEQFEYPAETERPIFKKPPPAPKPTLTHSTSPSRRGGRGGGNHRGGRNHYNKNQNDRRISNGAQWGAIPYLQSPPLSGGGPDYFSQNGNGSSLHDQLYKQYHFLEMQQHSLKAQLFAQAQARAMQAQAQAIAHQQTRNGASNGTPPKQQFANVHPHPRSADDSPTTAPMYPGGFLYQYPTAYDQSQQMSQSMSQDGIRTNPSSPSLSMSVPVGGRSVHRTSVVEGPTSGSIRSHSQPARGDQVNMVLQGYPPVPPYPPNIVGYQVPRSVQDAPIPPPSQKIDVPVNPAQNLSVVRETTQHGSPKDYVGYFVDEAPPLRPLYQDYSVPKIPSFQELAQRRREISPEMAPLPLAALSQPQPQPKQQQQEFLQTTSPRGGTGHSRNHSTGLRSTPASTLPLRTVDRPQPMKPVAEAGPVIVNGSYPTAALPVQRVNGSIDSNAFSTDRDSFSSLAGSTRNDEPFPMELSDRQHQPLYANELLRRHLEAESAGMQNGTGGVSGEFNKGSDYVKIPNLINPLPVNGENGRPSPPDMSPKSHSMPPWRANAAPNSVSPLDTTRLSDEASQATRSAGILSPVPEAITPSPTATRTPMSTGPQTNGLANGTVRPTTLSGYQPPKPSYPKKDPPPFAKKESPPYPKKDPSPTTEKSKAPGGNHGSHAWQKTTNKKGTRKRAKSAASKNGDAHRGEPIPVNEAERKGG